MKKNLQTKSLIVLVIIAMIITFATTMVKAEDENYSVSIALSSESKIKAGETVSVSINLTNVDAGNGIDTITSYIDYDTDVFEAVSKTSFEGSNGWSATIYNPANNMFSLSKDPTNKTTAPEIVAVIKLTAKQTINVDKTTITLKDTIASGGLVIAGGTGDINVNNATITISKAQDPVPSITQPENTAPANTAAPTNTTKSPAKTTNTAKDNTVTVTKNLPKAGMTQTGIILIVVVAIVAIFSYILYKKTAKDIK